MEYLTGFYGIGKKVANCVCLFGLHHIDAFPVDTWIEKILNEHYYDAEKYKDLPKARLFDQMITEKADTVGYFLANAVKAGKILHGSGIIQLA